MVDLRTITIVHEKSIRIRAGGDYVRTMLMPINLHIPISMKEQEHVE